MKIDGDVFILHTHLIQVVTRRRLKEAHREHEWLENSVKAHAAEAKSSGMGDKIRKKKNRKEEAEDERKELTVNNAVTENRMRNIDSEWNRAKLMQLCALRQTNNKKNQNQLPILMSYY